MCSYVTVLYKDVTRECVSVKVFVCVIERYKKTLRARVCICTRVYV